MAAVVLCISHIHPPSAAWLRWSLQWRGECKSIWDILTYYVIEWNTIFYKIVILIVMRFRFQQIIRRINQLWVPIFLQLQCNAIIMSFTICSHNIKTAIIIYDNFLAGIFELYSNEMPCIFLFRDAECERPDHSSSKVTMIWWTPSNFVDRAMT